TYPTMRAKKITNVLTTPWISVSVTMSPLATCDSSWPSTASTSSLFIDCSRPVDTATSDEFLNAPVANALGSPSYTATSGIATPAVWESLRIVSKSQTSASLRGVSMTCAPVDHFAIDFDIRSEMIAPTNPTTNENTSSEGTSIPFACTTRSSPSRRSTIDSTSTTARLVMRNRMIRFIGDSGHSIKRNVRPAGPVHKTLGCRGRLGPRVSERYRTVEDRVVRVVVDDVGDEIAVPLELHAILGQRADECRLDLRRDHALRR